MGFALLNKSVRTERDGRVLEKVMVNYDLIQLVEKNGNGSKIIFENGEELNVTGDVARLFRLVSAARQIGFELDE